jgi:glutamate-5-semialdehyde dehydrogenase
VIYESRPNVTVDVFSLCFKAGNAVVLKGGKEAFHSSQALAAVIEKSLQQQGIDRNVFYLLPPEREATKTLLHASGLIDVCIPRGSQALIEFVRNEAKIPVIETGAGIVHTYFDDSGDLEKGKKIINNAKTRRVSVCNALDSLVVHEKRLKDLPDLVNLLKDSHVILHADSLSYKALTGHYPEKLLQHATQEDFGREFLSHQLSIKTVASIEDAVEHIMHYTSGHSEAIIAESKQAISYFVKHVDAAVVYVNASTAFTDGGQFGLGAEIGISTQKLHARGPMALDALTSYQWIIYGNGQIR